MPPTTSLIVDIETRADYELMSRVGYQQKEGTFVPPLFHLPVSIAVGYVSSEGMLTQVDSLCTDTLHALIEPGDPCELTEAFWALINRTPILIGFNTRGFDLQVMEFCALRYGCGAAKYWGDQYGLRYRYSKDHVDLQERLSNYNGAMKGLSLSNVAQMLGYQGKGEIDGSMVQGLYDAGQFEVIQAYNRRDVLLTYAVWLHWARISGRLTDDLYRAALVGSKPFLDQIRPV